MYELALEPYDILIDYESISLEYSDNEIKDFLDFILANDYRFFMFCNKNTFTYSNENRNFLITDELNIYDIDEYEKMFMTGDQEQYRSLFISSDNQAIKVAISFGISCVFLAKTYNQKNIPDMRNFPDHFLILDDLKGLLEKSHDGVKLFLETKWVNAKYYYSVLYKEELKYYYDESKTVDVFMAGRYFRSNDLRAYSHILTRLILAFKDEKEGAYVSLTPEINRKIKELDKTKNIDYITSIPCKPSKNDRFEQLFYEDEKLISNKLETNLLSCTRDYDSQREFKTKKEKANNVKGAFKVNDTIDVEGKTILIIDDILTTGSTVLECASILFDRGAKRVILLPFGVTQDTYESMPRIPQIISNNEKYKLRFNRNNGNPFWVAGQGNFKNYSVVKETYLKQNDIKNYVYKE